MVPKLDGGVELVHDGETLVAALRVRGVDYLAPSDAQGGPVPDETLIASLAAHDNPRLVQALIALFMLQPQLAPLVPSLRARLSPAAEVELLAHYMAAVYLQSMWRIRLNHYRPPTPDLPDYFSSELSLPNPDDEYGKAGLYALADWHSAHAPGRANHLSEYEGVADLLLEDIRLQAVQTTMVGLDGIDSILRELAEHCHVPAQLYLISETSFAPDDFRPQTLDRGIAIELVADHRSEVIDVLREIRDRLGIMIEEVSLADSIPLPRGYEGRHEHLGRFGAVELFHFDRYSIALSKIARGRRQDLTDVVDAIKNGRIELLKLENMSREISPLMGQTSLNQDPQEFALNFAEFHRLWHAAGGTH